MIIKICGITKPQDAIFSIQQGAHWIGIIRHPASPRFCELEQAKLIAKTVRQAGGEPVAVFVNDTADQIQLFCQLTGITHVQLHGANARAQHHLLPDSITRIYVRHVQENGDCLADKENGQQHLKPTRDYLLFDALQGGSGQRYTASDLPIPKGLRFIIAGGVNPENAAEIIQQFNPDGIDICSGVELSPGVKDYEKIKALLSI